MTPSLEPKLPHNVTLLTFVTGLVHPMVTLDPLTDFIPRGTTCTGIGISAPGIYYNTSVLLHCVCKIPHLHAVGQMRLLRISTTNRLPSS